jgi:hypothetical protein
VEEDVPEDCQQILSREWRSQQRAP